MSNRTVDPFFVKIGEFLGVAPEEIILKQPKIPGELTCFGPKPKPSKLIPNIPQISNICYTFVLPLPAPLALCEAYQREYDELRAHLQELWESGAWEDVSAVAQRLSVLESLIEDICKKPRERVFEYCIFPDELFNDPFAGGQELPPKPPIPPLRKSK